MFPTQTRRSLFGDPASKRARLSEQNHPTMIERGRGIEFYLQGVEFDDDDIPGVDVEFPVYRSSPFLSPDGMAVFTVQSCHSKVGHMRTFTEHYFIVRHSITDGQGSYFRIAEFHDRHRFSYIQDHPVHFYALSDDRLGALTINRSQNVVNQYVIRIGHQPRLAGVTARRSFPIENSYSYSAFSLQLDNRIILSDEERAILILAADIEAPESNKYCHCCRLDGYFSRLEIEARNRNLFLPSAETLTLGRNGVYVCVQPRNGTEPFCVLGLEWQRNNELPADLCHRHAIDTVSVFYRFDLQFVTIHNGDWFQVASNGLVAFTYRRIPLRGRNQPRPKRNTLDVFVLDLTRLVHGDAHPEMRCAQSTISLPGYEDLQYNHLNLVPGTSSIIAQFGHPSNLLRFRSAFDVPPLRQLAFETVYKHMKPEERSKPGWMQTLCGFECV